MSLTKEFLPEKAIAKAIAGYQSQTSETFQEDLLRLTMEHRTEGKGILEVGCFHGGTTLVLNFICKRLGWPLYVIDINAAYLAFTRRLLEEVTIAEETSFYKGTFGDFVRECRVKERLNLVFIDGDHRYESAVEDIRSLVTMSPRPRYAAFHDFSLRSKNPAHGRIAVDEAIKDSWSDRAPLIRIGVQHGRTPVPSEAEPSASGSYWEANGSEGVYVDLAFLRSNEEAQSVEC